MSLDTQKENFMDSLLESSLTGKSLHLTSKKKSWEERKFICAAINGGKTDLGLAFWQRSS